MFFPLCLTEFIEFSNFFGNKDYIRIKLLTSFSFTEHFAVALISAFHEKLIGYKYVPRLMCFEIKNEVLRKVSFKFIYDADLNHIFFCLKN